jgi:transposase InsO family protein
LKLNEYKPTKAANLLDMLMNIENKQLTHFFNYPNSPKSNAFIERYNRTIKEQFVNRKDNCIENCAQTNKRIQDWLIWYNTKRYHRGINYQISLAYTITTLKCQNV